MSKSRYLYLDIIRIVACFLVLVNHTNSSIFLAIDPSPTWFASLAYFFLSKIAVPLFVMTSGAVLLGREEPYRKVLWRFLRVVAVLYVFSLLYYLLLERSWAALAPARLWQFLLSTYNVPITNSFWYLYLYMGLLLMLPLLRRLVQALQPQDYRYFFVCSWLFAGLWPMLLRYLPQIAFSYYLELPLFQAYVALFVMGYYLHTHPPKRSHLPYALAGIVLLQLFELGLTYYEYHRTQGGGYLVLDNTTYAPITLMAVAVFYAIQCWAAPRQFKERAVKWITLLSACTFGIYLLNDLLIAQLKFVRVWLDGYIHQLPAVVLYQILIFLVGLAITWCLRKIPGLKKLL